MVEKRPSRFAKAELSGDVSEKDDIFMIVGLGNPGKCYADSRHNVGYEVAMRFSQHHSIRVRRKRKLHSYVGVGEVAGKKVVAVVPTTFMNRSGEAVASAVGFYGVHPKNVLVIVDDVNLPLGRLRIRSSGSHGGHNGLKSVIASLGTTDFPRLRIGVGRENSGSLTDFVLGPFDGEEKPLIKAAIERAVEAAEAVLLEGVESAMNKHNQPCEPGSEAQTAKEDSSQQHCNDINGG